jgi:hypothetical protein
MDFIALEHGEALDTRIESIRVYNINVLLK